MTDDPRLLIIALKQEIEFSEERPKLVGERLAAAERLSALKEKEKEQCKLANIKELIVGMKSEIQFLKNTLGGDEKEWYEKWGADDKETNKDQEILRLKAQLKGSIAREESTLTCLRRTLAMSEAGIAIRIRKIEWAFDGKQDEKLLDMG